MFLSICRRYSLRQFLVFMMKAVYFINLSAFAILCVATVFAQSHWIIDSHILPKWLFAVVVLAVIGLCNALLIGCGNCSWVKNWWILRSIGVVCGIQAIYGLLQFVGLLPAYMQGAVTGSFDNPAGFASCLCIGLPFVAFLWSVDNKYVCHVGWLLVAFIVMAVVLSASRAGIISMVVMGVAYLFWKKKGKWRMGRYVLGLAVLLLFVGCYWLKKDSADGRLLIWQCSLEMVKDAPLWGHGVGSFEAHYMDYQAQYFEEHGQQGRYAMLADNVKHPFNEYIGVLLNFGLVGWGVLAGLVVWLIRCYRRQPSKEKRIAACALVGIGTFSLFSYPFTYPFTWIVTLLCIGLLAKESLQRLFASRKIKYVFCVTVLIASLACLYLWGERVRAELKWNKAARLALSGKYEESLPLYRDLGSVLGDNAYFLYNYAAVLQGSKRYAESLDVALQGRRYWADYDLEIVLGDNYHHLGKSEEAEAYYKHASLMCPSRFQPLYKLFHLYKEVGDVQQMKEIAAAIKTKPMKFKTSSILLMKKQVEREMKNFRE